MYYFKYRAIHKKPLKRFKRGLNSPEVSETEPGLFEIER